MPCMNLTSASVACTFERSVACEAATGWLDCPGAPGWTIGAWLVPAPVVLQPLATTRPSRINAPARCSILCMVQSGTLTFPGPGVKGGRPYLLSIFRGLARLAIEREVLMRV